jgi:DNA-binding response OmpR family regulator
MTNILEGDLHVYEARILLVEDDEMLRELIRRNLSVRHHEVSMAVDAGSALEHLRASTFDLIILDINLPDLSGWEVLRIANREGCFPSQPVEATGEKLPVVVVSAVRVSPRRLSEFRPLAYLPKPFPMDALLRLASEAATRRVMPDELVSDLDDGTPYHRHQSVSVPVKEEK